jgi:hypothetical protein
MANWAREDQLAASRWLAQQAPSSHRDIGAIELAWALVDSEPEMALQWANSIGQNDVRRVWLDKLAGKWFDRDPESASDYIRNSELDFNLGH